MNIKGFKLLFKRVQHHEYKGKEGNYQIKDRKSKGDYPTNYTFYSTFLVNIHLFYASFFPLINFIVIKAIMEISINIPPATAEPYPILNWLNDSLYI